MGGDGIKPQLYSAPVRMGAYHLMVSPSVTGNSM